MTLLLLTLMQRKAWLHVLAQSLLVAFCLRKSHSFGASFFLFTVSFAYVPYLIIGQLLYFLQTGRMTLRVFLPLLVVQFGLLEWGLLSIHTQFLPLDNSYLINFTYALALFIIVSQSNIHSFTGIPRQLANMSYSIYLLHGNIGIAVLNFLLPKTGFGLAFCAACATTLGASALSFRYIEKPSQQWARKLIKSRVY